MSSNPRKKRKTDSGSVVTTIDENKEQNGEDVIVQQSNSLSNLGFQRTYINTFFLSYKSVHHGHVSIHRWRKSQEKKT